MGTISYNISVTGLKFLICFTQFSNNFKKTNKQVVTENPKKMWILSELLTLNPPPTSPMTFSKGTGVLSKWTSQAAKHQQTLKFSWQKKLRIKWTSKTLKFQISIFTFANSFFTWINNIKNIHFCVNFIMTLQWLPHTLIGLHRIWSFDQPSLYPDELCYRC